MKIEDRWNGPYMQFNSDFLCYGYMLDSKPYGKFRYINIKTGNYFQIETPSFIDASFLENEPTDGFLIHKKRFQKYEGES